MADKLIGFSDINDLLAQLGKLSQSGKVSVDLAQLVRDNFSGKAMVDRGKLLYDANNPADAAKLLQIEKAVQEGYTIGNRSNMVERAIQSSGKYKIEKFLDVGTNSIVQRIVPTDKQLYAAWQKKLPQDKWPSIVTPLSDKIGVSNANHTLTLNSQVQMLSDRQHVISTNTAVSSLDDLLQVLSMEEKTALGKKLAAGNSPQAIRNSINYYMTPDTERNSSFGTTATGIRKKYNEHDLSTISSSAKDRLALQSGQVYLKVVKQLASYGYLPTVFAGKDYATMTPKVQKDIMALALAVHASKNVADAQSVLEKAKTDDRFKYLASSPANFGILSKVLLESGQAHYTVGQNSETAVQKFVMGSVPRNYYPGGENQLQSDRSFQQTASNLEPAASQRPNAFTQGGVSITSRQAKMWGEGTVKDLDKSLYLVAFAAPELIAQANADKGKKQNSSMLAGMTEGGMLAKQQIAQENGAWRQFDRHIALNKIRGQWKNDQLHRIRFSHYDDPDLKSADIAAIKNMSTEAIDKELSNLETMKRTVANYAKRAYHLTSSPTFRRGSPEIFDNGKHLVINAPMDVYSPFQTGSKVNLGAGGRKTVTLVNDSAFSDLVGEIGLDKNKTLGRYKDKISFLAGKEEITDHDYAFYDAGMTKLIKGLLKNGGGNQMQQFVAGIDGRLAQMGLPKGLFKVIDGGLKTTYDPIEVLTSMYSDAAGKYKLSGADLNEAVGSGRIALMEMKNDVYSEVTGDEKPYSFIDYSYKNSQGKIRNGRTLDPNAPFVIAQEVGQTSASAPSAIDKTYNRAGVSWGPTEKDAFIRMATALQLKDYVQYIEDYNEDLVSTGKEGYARQKAALVSRERNTMDKNASSIGRDAKSGNALVFTPQDLLNDSNSLIYDDLEPGAVTLDSFKQNSIWKVYQKALSVVKRKQKKDPNFSLGDLHYYTDFGKKGFGFNTDYVDENGKISRYGVKGRYLENNYDFSTLNIHPNANGDMVVSGISDMLRLPERTAQRWVTASDMMEAYPEQADSFDQSRNSAVQDAMASDLNSVWHKGGQYYEEANKSKSPHSARLRAIAPTEALAASIDPVFRGILAEGGAIMNPSDLAQTLTLGRNPSLDRSGNDAELSTHVQNLEDAYHFMYGKDAPLPKSSGLIDKQKKLIAALVGGTDPHSKLFGSAINHFVQGFNSRDPEIGNQDEHPLYLATSRLVSPGAVMVNRGTGIKTKSDYDGDIVKVRLAFMSSTFAKLSDEKKKKLHSDFAAMERAERQSAQLALRQEQLKNAGKTGLSGFNTQTAAKLSDRSQIIAEIESRLSKGMTGADSNLMTSWMKGMTMARVDETGANYGDQNSLLNMLAAGGVHGVEEAVIQDPISAKKIIERKYGKDDGTLAWADSVLGALKEPQQLYDFMANADTGDLNVGGGVDQLLDYLVSLGIGKGGEDADFFSSGKINAQIWHSILPLVNNIPLMRKMFAFPDSMSDKEIRDKFPSFDSDGNLVNYDPKKLPKLNRAFYRRSFEQIQSNFARGANAAIIGPDGTSYKVDLGGKGFLHSAMVYKGSLIPGARSAGETNAAYQILKNVGRKNFTAINPEDSLRDNSSSNGGKGGNAGGPINSFPVFPNPIDANTDKQLKEYRELLAQTNKMNPDVWPGGIKKKAPVTKIGSRLFPHSSLDAAADYAGLMDWADNLASQGMTYEDLAAADFKVNGLASEKDLKRLSAGWGTLSFGTASHNMAESLVQASHIGGPFSGVRTYDELEALVKTILAAGPSDPRYQSAAQMEKFLTEEDHGQSRRSQIAEFRKRSGVLMSGEDVAKQEERLKNAALYQSSSIRGNLLGVEQGIVGMTAGPKGYSLDQGKTDIMSTYDIANPNDPNLPGFGVLDIRDFKQAKELYPSSVAQGLEYLRTANLFRKSLLNYAASNKDFQIGDSDSEETKKKKLAAFSNYIRSTPEGIAHANLRGEPLSDEYISAILGHRPTSSFSLYRPNGSFGVYNLNPKMIPDEQGNFRSEMNRIFQIMDLAKSKGISLDELSAHPETAGMAKEFDTFIKNNYLEDRTPGVSVGASEITRTLSPEESATKYGSLSDEMVGRYEKQFGVREEIQKLQLDTRHDNSQQIKDNQTLLDIYKEQYDTLKKQRDEVEKTTAQTDKQASDEKAAGKIREVEAQHQIKISRLMGGAANKEADAEFKGDTSNYGSLLSQQSSLRNQILDQEKRRAANPKANIDNRTRLVNKIMLEELQEQYGDVTGQLGGIEQKYLNDPQFKAYAAEMQKKIGMKNEHADALRNVKEGGATTLFQNFKTSFHGLLNQFVQFGAAYKILGMVRGGIQNVVTVATQLDKAMTNIRIVTGDSREEAVKYMKSLSGLAGQLSVTTQETANAANDWFN